MNAPLAHWLIEQRAELLPRWIALLNDAPAAVASGMSAYESSSSLPELDEPTIAHPTEQQIVLALKERVEPQNIELYENLYQQWKIALEKHTQKLNQ